MEAVIFVGLQGAGKSTFFRERFADTHVRINLDMLKTRHRERQFFEVCISTGQSFVIDNTNLTSVDRRVYIEPAKEAGFRVKGYYFQSKIEDCKRRNELRHEKERIPMKGILGAAGRLQIPTKDEGFDDLFYVRIDEQNRFVVEERAMKFDDLDQKMRVFETAHDFCVLPGMNMVARLDGRNFTRLTKELHKFESPFDPRFRDLMVDTAEYLMSGCGFSMIYGYTESDEISLLFALEESAFGRKLRKLISILAAEASAKFSLLLGAMASFDCRISQLPTVGLVVDYFRWRNEDAHRNALNAHCYWLLRKQGKGVDEATAALKGLSVSNKNELLFQHGVNFNDMPLWQKRGVGLFWEEFERPAVNPVTGEQVTARRRRIRRELELPMKDDYSAFLRRLLADSEKAISP